MELFATHLNEGDCKISDFQFAVSSVYNELRSLGIQKDATEQLAHIAFSAIFSAEVSREIPKYGAFILKIFKKLGVTAPNVDILLNLQLLLEKSGIESSLFATISKYCYDENLLTEEFLLQWHEGKSNESGHFLYDQARNALFKEKLGEFIAWLKFSKMLYL